MLKFTNHVASGLSAAACAAGLLALGSPAIAEGSGGFTVLGQIRPPNTDSVSEAIGYGDLNLSTHDGQAALRRRVWAMAGKLCARLGESRVPGGSQVGSCEDQAFFDATGQMREAIAWATAPANRNAAAARGPNVLVMSVAAVR